MSDLPPEFADPLCNTYTATDEVFDPAEVQWHRSVIGKFKEQGELLLKAYEYLKRNQ